MFDFNKQVEQVFNVPKDHTPKVILVGSTNEEHMNAFLESHGENTLSIDSATKKVLGVPMTPVFGLLLEGKDKHIDAEISLPIQQKSFSVDVDDSLGTDLQRITDFVAGLMHSFCSSGSVSAFNIETNDVIFGSKDGGMFNVANIRKANTPNVPRTELMPDARLPFSADEILATPSKNEQEKKEVEDQAAVQRDIREKYGMEALKELLARTNQPLLIEE